MCDNRWIWIGHRIEYVFFVVFQGHVQDAYFYPLRLCGVPRYEPSAPERGWLCHGEEEELHR